LKHCTLVYDSSRRRTVDREMPVNHFGVVQSTGI